ncbi:MAG: IS66 family insertion sequence element accessory protein TnpB [Kofleriaceae bacterium]
MLPVTVRRVFLAEHRVDFRKGFDGLLAETYRLGCEPYEGDCVVFIKKDRTQIRALVGDAFGLYLVSRRFEGGRLSKLLEFTERPGKRTISTGELSLLMEGSSFTVHKRANAWRITPREDTPRA